MNKKSIIVGSPIYQKPEILQAFLKSLKNLIKDTIFIDYMFVDDNINENSSRLLAEFEREESTVIIVKNTRVKHKGTVLLCYG